MSEGTPNEGGDKTPEGTPTPDSQFTPITTQEDLNRVIQDRVKREQAKFADYKELKAKAGELDKLTESSKTEIEKAIDRAAAAEAEVAAVPAKVSEALKEHLVALHSINEEDAELFLTATEPDLLLKQVERLMGRASEEQQTRKQRGLKVPAEGSNPTAAEDETREFARALFNRS
jgi:hypothetical protein